MGARKGKDGLTDKERLFIAEYSKDKNRNGTQAAIRAGYSERTAQEAASRLLSKVMIKQAIEAMDEKIIKRVEEQALVSVEWVIKNFKEIAERCMQHQAVKDKEGNETGEYTFNATGANKSLELIGKYLKMFGEEKADNRPTHLYFIENLNQYAGKTLEGSFKTISHD